MSTLVVCLGCRAAEFGSSGGTYELPCTFISTSLNVSGNCVSIIRRTYCIYATCGLTSQPADQTATTLRSHPNQHTRQPPDCSLIPASRPDSHHTAVSSQPADQTATRLQSHPNQQTRQPPDCSLIPTSRPDSHQAAVSSQPADQTTTKLRSHIPTSRPDSHSKKYQCRIDTVSSPDDGHSVVRNM